jgi:hypothetical protein
MHVRQVWRQLQLVSHFTSLLQNLEWSNEPWCELASDLEMTQTSHRQHLEVHKISHFQVQLSSPMISIALLPRLCNSQIRPNHTNLLLGFLQNVEPKHLPFSILTPKQWSLTTSQTVPFSSFLDSYCYRRTQLTIDSYVNYFHIARHKLLAYPLESD